MLTLALLGYVALAGSVGVWSLRGRAWMQESPAAGVRVWTGLALSLPGALLAAALNLLTSTAAGHSVADLVHACVAMVRQAFVGPVGATGAEVGSLAVTGLVLHVVVKFILEVGRSHRARRRYCRQLALVAGRRTYGGAVRNERVLILEHALPLAFCLPGKTATIVLSSSALTHLDQPQLDAVLEHERSHLRRHDHLTLAWSRAVARGLWFLPGLRQMTTEQQRLVEMVADDRAARRMSPRTVADALLQLARIPGSGESSGVSTSTSSAGHGTPTGRSSGMSPGTSSSGMSLSMLPVGELGAADQIVMARIERLTHPRAYRRAALLTNLLATLVIVLLPSLLVSAGWAAAAAATSCPVD